MKKFQSKQKGFTLIELIVVIVILGVMSAIAVPQFIDLQEDARMAVADGVEGSLRSAATLAYSKSLIDGTEGVADSDITTNLGTIETINGYPEPTAAGIGLMVDLSNDIVATYAGDTATFTVSAIATCVVTYQHAAAQTTPVIDNSLALGDC